MDKYNILTILASRYLNLKVFVSDRSNPNKDLPYLISLLKNLTYRYATGIIAQTPLAKDVITKKTGNENVVVIPNPVKQVSLIPNVEKQNIIISVGRLVQEKGHKYLLEAFSKLYENTWKLVILGDGPLRDELQDYAKELKIDDYLYMPGSVKNVDEWLSKSSIFAFTSVSEGFPNAILEAMASGLPIIAIDCIAGPSDLVKNKVNGFLIRMNQKEEYIKCLNNMMKDADLTSRFSHNSLTIAKEYDINSIGRKYLNFILS